MTLASIKYDIASFAEEKQNLQVVADAFVATNKISK